MITPQSIFIGRIQLRETAQHPRVKYYIYLPRSYRIGDGPGQVLVAVHGISRNARSHAQALAGVAETLGVPLVAPLFACDTGKGYQQIWSAHCHLRADLALNAALEHAAQALNTEFSGLLLTGYSGGAQFAHRYALANPERIAALAIGAAGWYTMPDARVAYPRGIAPTGLPPGTRFDVAKLLRRPVLVYVGAKDRIKDRSLRADADLDLQQGANRIERAQRWCESMSAAARCLGLVPRLSLRIIPRVSHDFEAAIAAGLPSFLTEFFRSASLQRVAPLSVAPDRIPVRRKGSILRYAALAATAALAAGVSATAGASGVSSSYKTGQGLSVSGYGWVANIGATLAGDTLASDSGANSTRNALLRRARLTANLNFGPRWTLRADQEFSTVGPGLSNLWVQWRATDHLALRLGSQRAPFGLEDGMAFRARPFTERSLANALVPGTLNGLSLRANTDRSTFVAGVFANSISAEDRRALRGSSLVARGTTGRRIGKLGLLQFGASAEYRRAQAGTVLRLRARPETLLADERLVDTGSLRRVKSLTNIGADIAWRAGPVLLQGEWINARVARDARAPLNFAGGYVSASWALTGETRHYSARSGNFLELEPRHRFGAFELAARASTLDLASATVSGGRETNLSIGLNWYPRDNARVMMDWVRADVRGRRVAVPSRNYIALRFDVSL